MKKFLLFSAAALLVSGMAAGESLNLTVEQAVEMALKENLSLQRSGIDLSISKRDKQTRWNTFLPGISATASLAGTNQLFTDETGIPKRDEDSLFNLNAGMNISLPLNAAMASQMKQLVADYEAGLLTYESARRELERDVRKQFYMLLASKENIRLQESNMALAENRLEQARANYASGLIPELEVLSAEVTVAGLRPEYDSAVARYEKLMLFFKFLIGASQDDELTLEGSMETRPVDLDAQKLIEANLAGRLDLRKLDKQIESLKYSVLSAGLGAKSPSLILGYNYGYSGSRNYLEMVSPLAPPALHSDWGKWMDNGTFSIALNWKLDGLIPGSSGDVVYKNLKSRLSSLELARNMAREKAEIDITNLVNDLSVARKNIEASTSTVELAQKTFELTEEAYRAGSREILDVESAQNNVMKASLQLLMARYNYIAAILDLEYELNTTSNNF
ncbi:MAG: hypothetical protein CSA76_02075 [Spirochaetales bacterium]|nr:MAG: hypothetical protein CSA76_02075 [Spirochaetales bacterium]